MIIKPKLKNLFIQFSPQETKESVNNFWTIINANIGSEESRGGADIFLFYATSPKKLQEIIIKNSYVFGHPLIIIEKYSEELIKKAIGKLLEDIDGDTWEQVAMKNNKLI